MLKLLKNKSIEAPKNNINIESIISTYNLFASLWQHVKKKKTVVLFNRFFAPC